MYREEVQLEILDTIANHQDVKITAQTLLEKYPDDLIWKWNYQCLHVNKYVLPSENGLLVVTLVGEQRRVDLREKFQSQKQTRWTNWYVKRTFWVALAGLFVALASLALAVFQRN